MPTVCSDFPCLNSRFSCITGFQLENQFKRDDYDSVSLMRDIPSFKEAKDKEVMDQMQQYKRDLTDEDIIIRQKDSN